MNVSLSILSSVMARSMRSAWNIEYLSARKMLIFSPVEQEVSRPIFTLLLLYNRKTMPAKKSTFTANVTQSGAPFNSHDKRPEKTKMMIVAATDASSRMSFLIDFLLFIFFFIVVSFVLCRRKRVFLLRWLCYFLKNSFNLSELYSPSVIFIFLPP